MGALAHDDAHVCDGALVCVVSVVFHRPIEIIFDECLPAAIFAEPGFGTDDVEVRHEPRSCGLTRPDHRFLRRLCGVAPAHRAGGPRAGDVGRHLPFLDGVGDAALQRAEPDGFVLAAAALIVALKPIAEFAETIEIHRGARAAAGICEEEAVGLFLFGERVVGLPEKFHAVVEFVPVCGRSRRREVFADRAVALRKFAERRPAVAVEGVNVVRRVHFADDRRDVFGHVAGEHAGANEARLLVAAIWGVISVALEPIRVSFKAIVPIEVGTHAGDDAHAALFRSGAAFAEEITITEKLAFAVERHFRLVVGENAGDADEDNVGFDAGPEVGPGFDVHDGGVVLSHVELADAADAALPRKSRVRCRLRQFVRRHLCARFRRDDITRGNCADSQPRSHRQNAYSCFQQIPSIHPVSPRPIFRATSYTAYSTKRAPTFRRHHWPAT